MHTQAAWNLAVVHPYTAWSGVDVLIQLKRQSTRLKDGSALPNPGTEV